MHSKTKGLIWIFGTVGIVYLFILALPYLAKTIPWSVETKMGKVLQDFPDTKVCKSDDGSRALQKLVDRLHPILPNDSEFPVSVKIISGQSINAFASFGGQIYVYDGLLQKAESDDELAGVLAHEMEHVRHRHIIQGAFVNFLTLELANLIFDPGSAVDPRFLHLLMNLQFSRAQETEADTDGLRRLQAAHIDTAGFARFFKREENQSSVPTILSDPPSSENRSELAKQFPTPNSVKILEASEWTSLKKICSL